MDFYFQNTLSFDIWSSELLTLSFHCGKINDEQMDAVTIIILSSFKAVKRAGSMSLSHDMSRQQQHKAFHSTHRSDLIDSNTFQRMLVWNFCGRCYIAPNICWSVSVVTRVEWLNIEATSIYGGWNISVSSELQSCSHWIPSLPFPAFQASDIRLCFINDKNGLPTKNKGSCRMPKNIPLK